MPTFDQAINVVTLVFMVAVGLSIRSFRGGQWLSDMTSSITAVKKDVVDLSDRVKGESADRAAADTTLARMAEEDRGRFSRHITALEITGAAVTTRLTAVEKALDKA